MRADRTIILIHRKTATRIDNRRVFETTNDNIPHPPRIWPAMSTNEHATSHRKVADSSDRAFGIVFAVFFVIVGSWPLLHSAMPRWWSYVLALAFLIAALVTPRLLSPLNYLWQRIGLALHHIVNPIIMGLIYYLAVVPMGLLLKARGKDILRLKRDPKARTYWIARTPPGPAEGSMSKQF